MQAHIFPSIHTCIHREMLLISEATVDLNANTVGY